ncbi:uncharacterized protein B0H64DRAFT_473954 [Chaetomium fimeti]|uniref:Uncharacterized protein n=1 Tax=Chaetomium fimeti TaxID=1854472 RepID=A0AAE0HJX5_9PEZI|nr:hypothetical protein B0H64DRAFT_473954 [Chaetomium fimeti]
MVSFTTLLTATLATVAAASPALRLYARQDGCQGVRDAIAANGWPCVEVTAGSCQFCCESWFNLAAAYSDPQACHGASGEFTCPAGSDPYHCDALILRSSHLGCLEGMGMLVDSEAGSTRRFKCLVAKD